MKPLRLSATLLPLASLLSAHAQAEQPLLADNSQVLSAFAQSTGAAPPELVRQEDGGTRIEWKGSVAVDLYDNRVRVPASTGNVTSPQADGNFHRIQVSGDLRGLTPDNRIRYLQFMATQSDDRAVQSYPLLFNSVQAGHVSATTQLAVGDVNADFSALGTRLGVRGVLATTLLGPSTLSVSAGTLAPTWNAVMDEDKRTEYLRNLISAKLDAPLSATTRGFFSVQGYTDDPATVPLAQQTLLPASGHAATLGLAHQDGALALTAEAGLSRWSPEGQADRDAHALVLDGSWTGASTLLRFGHHRLGTYYTSLSAEAQPGIRETYLAADWRAADWLNVQGDLRRSENEAVNVAGGVAAVRTDAATFSETLGFGPNWPGLSLVLQQALSDGENPGGSDNRQWGYGAQLGYAAQAWNGAIAFNRRALRNDAAPTADGTTDTWSLSLGRTLMDDPSNPIWQASLGANASWQGQELDAGGSTQATQLGFNVAATHNRLGSFAAGISLGWVDPTTGDDLKNLAYTLEATHPFKGDKGSVKLYARDTRYHSGNPLLRNDARTLGIQLALNF